MFSVIHNYNKSDGMHLYKCLSFLQRFDLFYDSKYRFMIEQLISVSMSRVHDQHAGKRSFYCVVLVHKSVMHLLVI